MTYYNTTELIGEDLLKEIENAKTQEDKILLFFERNPLRYFVPSEILSSVFSYKVPITSVRRAITNLTNSGKLTKTDKKKIGSYGKSNFCWKLNISI